MPLTSASSVGLGPSERLDAEASSDHEPVRSGAPRVKATRSSPGGSSPGTVSDEEPVFASRKRRNANGGHLDPSAVNRVVARAAKKAGIDRPVSPHWLRHAHASHAHARGTDLALIRDTLRHSSISTTGRYLHARPSDSSALHLGF